MMKRSMLAGAILALGFACVHADVNAAAIPTGSVAVGRTNLHEKREHRDQAEEKGADRREQRKAHGHQSDATVGGFGKHGTVDRLDLLLFLGLGAYLFSVGFFEGCLARTRNERLLGCGAFILGGLLLLLPLSAYAAVN